MDYQASSSKKLFSGFQLLHSHALLNCGSEPQQLYQSATHGETGIRSLPGIIMGGRGRMSAAIYPPFDSLSSYGRVEKSLGEALPTFCRKKGISVKCLHVHGPMKTLGGFNPVYLNLYLKGLFPDSKLILTQGKYCDGLIQAFNQIPEQTESFLSIAMDSLVDDQSIKNYLKKYRHQPITVPGEAYVFFHFQKTKHQSFCDYFAPGDIKGFQARMKSLKRPIAAICYQELVTPVSIQHLLDFQRALFKDDEIQSHNIQWLSPYPLCADSGAAQQALGLMLSYGAAKSLTDQWVIMLNQDNSFLVFKEEQ